MAADKYVTAWELHCFLSEAIKKYGPNIPVVFEDKDPAHAKGGKKTMYITYSVSPVGIAPCRNYNLSLLFDERSDAVQPVFIISEKENPFLNPA